MTQEQALEILKTGANVFLTGEPGSGKTHTINQYVDYLRSRGVDIAVTASTGIAATHIGGLTIHSWSGIGIKKFLNKYEMVRITSNERLVKRIERVKVLIIDEMSMLSNETLGMVDAVCRDIRRSREPFGGIQVVLVGDFFQLPPVVKEEAQNMIQKGLMERPRPTFAYNSPAWARAKPIVCYLTGQYRQDDIDFLSLLSSIRRNNFGEVHLARLLTRKIEYTAAPSGVPKLFTHNVDVDRVNAEMLAKLPGEPRKFQMSQRGHPRLVEALKNGCLSPENLCLKINAAVMFTKNNIREGFVNGTLGTVLGFKKETGWPVVKTWDGKQIEVEPMEWMVEDQGRALASITQFPLRLAWAITVHKSQGMSMDAAAMDLSQVFEFGQGYVALSRVRRLSGLHLFGWNERAFQVHPEVLAKDASMRAESEANEIVFSKIAPDELDKIHKNFIRTCGGKDISESGNNNSGDPSPDIGETKNGFSKIRETHPNAYRPWSEEEDAEIRGCFYQGMSVKKMAEKFNRTKGAIRSRLNKFKLRRWQI